MGSYLDRPVTSKECHKGAANGLTFGVSSMQGWRVSMEDAHVAEGSIATDGDLGKCSLFAVFDGHGGDLVAKMSEQRFKQRVTTCLEREGLTKAGVETGMTDAYLSMDADMLAELERIDSSDASGCTAISGLVTPEFVCVANAGDCRAILMVDGTAVPMSYDHKPYNAGEKARIEKAGGWVSMKRVNGDLAVSRALGDYDYKQASSLPAEAQQVCAKPDFKFFQRGDGNLEFLLLCCDGVWDVMSNDEAGAFVRSAITNGHRGMPVEDICSNLLDCCLKKGSRDNMTACLVIFKEKSELDQMWLKGGPPPAEADGGADEDEGRSEGAASPT